VFVREDENGLSVVATPGSVKVDRSNTSFECLEYGIAALLVLLDDIYPETIVPSEVRLLRPTPPDSASFEQVLRCPVFFDCPEEVISFDAHVADLPLSTSIVELASFQDSLTKTQIDKINEGSFTMMVKRAITRHMAGTGPRMPNIAEDLYMSCRTLQRRLKNENAVFQDLVRDIRRQLCIQLMDANQHRLTEMSFLLGFSSQSNFSRAFKSWFDSSPREYMINASSHSRGKEQAPRV
jgi:AraC-like DNA-binding protein